MSGIFIPKPASFPKPTWLEGQIVFVGPDGTELPTRLAVKVIGPLGVIADDPRNKQLVLDLTRLLGNPQQTATVGDTSPHIIGTGIDVAAGAGTQGSFTSVDAEVYAEDNSGNWAWWRITQGYRRVGTGSPSAVSGSPVSPTGFPKGSNAGAPPIGWAASFALGTGVDANTAFVQVTGPARWYFYLDGSRYPGDELALALTIDGVWPSSGDPAGGTASPTFVSISPTFGPTGGGP